MLRHWDAEFPYEPFAGIVEGEFFVFHDEVNVAASFSAGETLPLVARWTETETGRVVVVAEAESLAAGTSAAVLEMQFVGNVEDLQVLNFVVSYFVKFHILGGFAKMMQGDPKYVVPYRDVVHRGSERCITVALLLQQSIVRHIAVLVI